MYLIQNKGEEMAGKIIKLWFIFLLMVLWSTAGWAGDDQSKKDDGANPASAVPWHKKLYLDGTEYRKGVMEEHNPFIHPGEGATGVFEHPIIKAAYITTSPYYDTVGSTYYTVGANDRLQRHVALSALNYTHASLTKITDKTTFQPRDIYYSAWSNLGALPHQEANEVQVSDLIDGEEGRGGFTMVTTLPDGRCVVVYHRAFPREPDSLPKPGTYVALEENPAEGDFAGNEFHVPDSVPPMRDEGIWPDGAAQKIGDTNFVHIVSTEGNYNPITINTRYFTYSRGRENPANFFGAWSTPRIVDTLRGYLSPTIVASHQSEKVAIIWTHPRKGYPGNPANSESLSVDADLYYIESTDGGADWLNGFHNDANDGFKNITNYADTDPLRASGDLTAAYDEDDSLVVTFYAAQFVPSVGVSRAQGAIYFWRKGIGGGGDDVKEVYNASIDDANVSRLQDTWPIMNPQIGIYKGAHPDSVGDYYIIWTGPGGPSDTTENDVPLEGFYNYDIFCSATTNNGFSWSSVTNLTNSHTPACTLGGCDSDWFASLARTINDTLHITYINNRVPIPGGQTLNTDSSRLAYVFYLKSPAKFIFKDTLASVAPIDFDDFDFQNGVTNDTFLFVANAGNQDLTVNSITSDHPAASATVTNYSAPPFTILEGGEPAKITLSFNGAAANTPCSSYTVTWTFNTNAENYNLSNPIGEFTATAEFALTDGTQPFFKPRSLTQLNQIVQVNATRLSVSNTGTLGGGGASRAGMAVDSVPGVSSIHFLSQGTAYMAAILSNGDTLVARDIYEENQFHPLYIEGALTETIDVQNVNFVGDLTFAQALAQGRPAKAGDWKVAKVAYGMYVNEDENLAHYDTLYPWPGVWFGYWFKDQWWWKNTATYKWTVWYRQKVKKGPPCWWPQWPGQPTIVSKMYDGVAIDWDPLSDSVDLSTGVQLPINSTAYNDTFKFAYARGRGNPFDKRYAAQIFLVDTTMHLKTDSVCVFNAGVLHCSTAVHHSRGIFGTHPLSWEDFVSQYGGYRTKDLWKWVTRPGSYTDTSNFLNNKEDVTILTTHTVSDTSDDTIAYAIGLAVTTLGLDTMKKTVNEIRLNMALDTIKLTTCTYRPADVDGNGNWTLTDIVGLVNMVFKSAAKPTPLCRTDCNATGGNPNLTDIVCLVNKVFKGAANPPIVGECCKLTP